MSWVCDEGVGTEWGKAFGFWMVVYWYKTVTTVTCLHLNQKRENFTRLTAGTQVFGLNGHVIYTFRILFGELQMCVVNASVTICLAERQENSASGLFKWFQHVLKCVKHMLQFIMSYKREEDHWGSEPDDCCFVEEDDDEDEDEEHVKPDVPDVSVHGSAEMDQGCFRVGPKR